MESFGKFVSQNIPWLWPLLGWTLAVLAIFAVATFPAYLIFYPILSALRRVVGSYLAEMRQRHAAARDRRNSALRSLVEDLRANAGLSYVSEANSGFESAQASFASFSVSLRAQLNAIHAVPNKLEALTGRLVDTAAKAGAPFPALPGAEHVATQYGSLRTAKWRVFISSLFLLALISVNTGMLGQILRALGFIPHDLNYFGIPLFMVFAFILTLVEAGLGYLHTAWRPAPEEATGVAIGPAMAMLLAGIIACVEGFFYSQVAPDQNAAFNLPGGLEVKQSSLFFLWGVALVGALFGLGSVLSSSLEYISRSADTFAAAIRRLTREQEIYERASQGVAANARQVRENLESATVTLHSLTIDADKIMNSISRLPMEGDMPSPMTPRAFTEAEARHFSYLAGVWFTLTLIGTVVVTAAAAFVTQSTFPSLTASADVAIGLGIAGSSLVLGVLLPRGYLLLDGTGSRRLIISGSIWRGRVTAVIAVLFAVVLLLLMWQTRSVRVYAALWVVVYALGGCLAAAANQSAAMGKGLRLWLNSCALLGALLLEAITRLGIRLVFLVVYVAEVISLCLAGPIYVLRGRQLPSVQGVA